MNTPSPLPPRTVLITGCYGFIGTHVVRHWLQHTGYRVIGLDALTYAARPHFLRGFLLDNPTLAARFTEVIADIRDAAAVGRVMRQYAITDVIHLAAESHVCRSIQGPKAFYETNVMGTFNLIDEFAYQPYRRRFLHVSTDEVFGELGMDSGKFDENWKLQPRSPYAASKAAAEHVVRSHALTYDIDTIITNCTNNFGPYQHEEKLIPKTVSHLLKGERPKLYGSGLQVRDWLHVDDHANGLLLAFEKGEKGHTYCFGGGVEKTNQQMIRNICEILEKPFDPIYTDDRPTDDTRYAINYSKARDQLGWTPCSMGVWWGRLKQTVHVAAALMVNS